MAGPSYLIRALASVRGFLRGRGRTALLLAAGQVAAAVVIAAGACLLALHLRDTAIRQGELRLGGLSMLLADQAERAFEAVKLTEELLAQRLAAAGADTPDGFRAVMGSAVMHASLVHRVDAMRQLLALNAASSDGDIVGTSRGPGGPPVNIADRDYFIRLRSDPSAAFVVSKPFENRSTGAWTIYLALAVRGPEGFAGAFIGSIDLGYFEALYRDVASAPGQSVSMFRTDNILLVRYPRADPKIGTDLGSGLAFTRSAAPSEPVVVRKASAIDGQDTLIAATPLKRFPVAVNAMQTVRSLLEEWRWQAAGIAAGAAAIESLCLLLGLAAVRFAGYQRRLDRAMFAADAAEAAVRAAQERDRERLEQAARMQHLAHHDPLTGLPNRALFLERLDHAVARAERGHETYALLYLDLDHFKAVNDTLGHPVGDALLQGVTARLARETRESDTVARLGGDEFAVIQSGVGLAQDAGALAARLVGALSAPYEIDGHPVVIGASVGITLVTGGCGAGFLLKQADLALYKCKAEGRAGFRFFSAEMDDAMQARRAMELDLRRGLRLREFVVHYQPLMNIKQRRVTGFEALLRWQHPVRGLVPPDAFIPLAEEIGLIVPLGLFVLRQACRDAAAWPGGTKVAVNVSAVQFANSKTLVADVAAALADSGLDAGRLDLEITETVMLEDTDAVLSVLHSLRGLGVGIAMDDFGTGYSSLSYLRKFPFSKVKIDRSFIAGLGADASVDAIVSAVTDLCGTLGIATVAEGVETEGQLDRLRGGNCNEAQGFLFARPCPAGEIAALCESLSRSP